MPKAKPRYSMKARRELLREFVYRHKVLCAKCFRGRKTDADEQDLITLARVELLYSNNTYGLDIRATLMRTFWSVFPQEK